MSFKSAPGGHASGDIRDRFIDTLEQIANPRLPLIDRLGLLTPMRTLTGWLWNCTDILPDHAVSYVEDFTGKRLRRSTYAGASRLIRAFIDEVETAQ